MSHLFAYCDEGGKEHSHPIVLFNSLVAGLKQWEEVSQRWTELLRRYDLPNFHANQAFRYSLKYGSMKPGTAEDRAKDILPFVRSIVEGVDLGVIAAIDVSAYKLPKLHRLRLNISDDPHYFAFYLVLSLVFQHPRVLPEHTVGLILDEDEAKAMSVYKFLLRMKKANRETKRRVTSISFMDDKMAPQLQAVDLFTYLCRIDAERIFLAKRHPFMELSEQFNREANGREKIEISGGYFGEDHLREYMDSHKS